MKEIACAVVDPEGAQKAPPPHQEKRSIMIFYPILYQNA